MTVLTRLETTIVTDAVAETISGLDQANERLEAIAPRLTKKQRRSTPKPPHSFPDAARAMVEMAEEDAPDLAAACKFDGPAVLEDLENAERMIPLIARLKAMLRTAEDARLQWLAEAYAGTLPMYRVAVVRAADDPALQSVMTPLQEIFASAPRAVAEDEAEEPAEEPAEA